MDTKNILINYAGTNKEEGKNGKINKFRRVISTGGKIESISGTPVWHYMLAEHSLNVEQLNQFRQAVTIAKIDGKPAILVRIFDPAFCRKMGIEIKDFDDLDDYARLILYDGYYEKGGNREQIFLENRDGNDSSSLQRKIGNGSITNVGIKEEDTTTVKLLRCTGKFMMYVGWMLVVIIIFGIIFLTEEFNKVTSR